MKIYSIAMRKTALILCFLFLSIALFSAYNVNVDREKLKAQRNDKVWDMKADKNVNSGSYKALDLSIKEKARKLEADRQAALKEIFDEAGVKWPPDYTGTPPKEGGGILSDNDTKNMPKEDLDKIVGVMKQKNDIADAAGNSRPFTITEKTAMFRLKNLMLHFSNKILMQGTEQGLWTKRLSSPTK